MTHEKLFIPGPVEVPADTLAAGAKPMVGHRDRKYSELHKSVREKLQKVLGTTSSRTLHFTSSATGVMEAGILNLVNRRVLNLCCGAFSERWHQIALACGKEADAINVEWGQPNTAEQVRDALQSGDYDAVTLVHNETSTGVMNDLEGIARAVREVGGDDVCFMVDAVTSMSAVPIAFDEWGIDLGVSGSQKAWAMPPGLAVATISERALARAETVSGRGFYFDFLKAVASDDKDQTPSTPGISLIYALEHSLQRMLDEGMEARYARHRAMAERCRAWAGERLGLFPAEADCSQTLTVVAAGEVDVPAMLAFLRSEKGVVLANGYGKLKNQTFRIGHMGEITLPEVEELLGWLDEFLTN